MEIYISDDKVPVMVNSLQIEDEVEAHSSASFTVRDLDNQLNFQRGELTEIHHNQTLIFRGFIEMADKVPLTKKNNYIWRVECSDMHYVADKRIVAFSETSTTAGSIVGKIVDDYLEQEGVENTLRYWFDYEQQTWEEVIS